MRWNFESILLLLERHAGILLAMCVAGIVVACLYPFNFFIPNQVSDVAGKEIEFSKPSIAWSADSVGKLAGIGQFTISLRIMPPGEPLNQWRGQIIGSELNEQQRNFSLVQRRKDLCVSIRPGSGDVPRCALYIRDIFGSARYLWIDLVYDGSTLRSYVNGVPRDSTVDAHPLSWVGSYPLVAGNSADLRHPWSGRIDTFALFPVPLADDGLNGGWRDGGWGKPLILYSNLDPSGTVIRDDGINGSADLLVPEYYRPYRPLFLQFFKKLDNRDIVINIIGFMPIGFLLSLVLRRSILSPVVRVLVILGFGLSLSLSMEFLQIYLPSRISGIADLVSNSTGLIPGYFMYQLLYGEVS